MEKASKLSDKCSIIIPAIDLDRDAKKCIKESLLQKKVNVTIYLITNKKVKKIFKSKKISKTAHIFDTFSLPNVCSLIFVLKNKLPCHSETL